jgi:selT/selW/selH-like putative selenoprotein
VSLRNALKKEFGSQVEPVTLQPSSGGVFDVQVGGQVVYSKFKTGRFPNREDVAAIKEQVKKQLS